MSERPPRSEPPVGPIFVGGTGRSGTTLLVRILSRLKGVFAYTNESRFLVAPGGLLQVADRGWRRRELGSFGVRLCETWFDRVNRNGRQVGLRCLVSAEELETALRQLEERIEVTGEACGLDPVAEFCGRIFGPATHAAGASRWCEKTPRNALFVDRLFAIFPDMRFLHIVRDGRDVVASMLAKGFWPMTGHGFRSLRRFRGPVTAQNAARYWVEVLAASRAAAAAVPSENYRELRFEDLVAQPEAKLVEICDFLGEPFSGDLLAEDLTRHHIGRWRQDLRPRQQAALLEIAGEALDREGYPVSR